eukprot:GHVO01009544.1.p1 GENE.GHVO01009544.1~~GHVO01009544.1.p1  ORF type:complete len:218 (+),score=1.27 GHVO01009544.1:23-655(+)
MSHLLSVRDLGAVLDPELTMERQINSTISSAYFHLRRLSKIRCHIDQAACTKAILSTVMTRIDYHNALLISASEKNIQRLQIVQNNAARLVTSSLRRAHITPILRTLHWTPVKQRIDYKIAVITHKAIHHHTPSYISDMCPPYQPTRTLRSAQQGLLKVPTVKRRNGQRSFYHYAPSLWNSLPEDFRFNLCTSSFKRLMKTHLFNIAFNS